MEYNTHTLPNGLRVIHLPSVSPVIYCGYEVNAGTRDELPTEEGMAHFCEHVTFKGTARRKAWQILNCMDSVGGDLNAYTNKEDTVYYAAAMKEHAERMVDILTDIVFHSVYPQNEINKEAEVIRDEIESYNDTPSDLIYDEFENLVFHGHPLGHSVLGTVERVRGFKTMDALRFTSKFYTPANSIFFAYGDVDFGTLVKCLERATADLPKTMTGINERNDTLAGYTPMEVVRRIDSHQTHVMIGNRAYGVSDERRIPLYLLNNILGGPGMNNRLNVSLRERHGLVYTVESSMVSYGDTGVWCLYFGCAPRNFNRCRALVRKELDNFMATPLTERQLNAAKKQVKGQIGVGCDNRENFALDFGKNFLHHGWEKDIDALYQDIDAVTPGQMQAVALEIFPRERLTTLVFE